MSTFFRKCAAGLASAAAIATFALGGAAIAQDAESIRAKCINQAAASYPGTSVEGPESRARVETYIVCMRQHGLTP